jgi:hypothetical protein
VADAACHVMHDGMSPAQVIAGIKARKSILGNPSTGAVPNGYDAERFVSITRSDYCPHVPY